MWRRALLQARLHLPKACASLAATPCQPVWAATGLPMAIPCTATLTTPWLSASACILRARFSSGGDRSGDGGPSEDATLRAAAGQEGDTAGGDDGGASSSSSSDTDGGTSESNDNNSGTDADDVDADDAVADGDVQADKENQSEEDEEDLEFPDPNDWGEYWTPDHKQPWDPPDEMEGHMDKLFSELFKLPRKQFDAVTTFTKEELLGQEPIQVYLSSDDEEDTNPDWQFTEQDWQFITWDPHYDKLQLMAASEELRPHVRAWAKQRIEKIDAHWAAVRKHVEQHGTWPMRDPLEDPPSDTDSDDELPVEDTEDGLLPEVMGPLGGGRRLVTRAEDQFRGRSTVKPLSDDEDIFEDRHRYVGVLGGEEERGDQSGGDDGRGPHAAGDHDTSDIDEQQLYAPILDDQGKRLYADAEEEQHTTLGPNRRGSSDHPMGDDQDDDDPMPKLTPAEEAALARMLNATSSDEEDDGRRAMVGREDKGYSSDDEEGMFDLTTFGVQAEAAGFWEAEEAGSDSEQNSPGVFEEYDPGKDMLPVFSGSEHGMLVHPYYINAETAQTLWGVDLVGGEIVSPERNALLSDATKMEMYQRHTADPGLWSTERLARHYRIREERVIAIITLKQREQEARERGELLMDDLADFMENEVYGCKYRRGTGERHIVKLPVAPRFVPGDFISEVDEVEKDLAIKEQSIMLSEFKERLEWAQGKVGKSLRRGVSRHKSAPRKPKDGWSLVVRPLTPGQGDGYGEAYVAQPDGSRRQLTEDEQYYLYRQRPRKRRRRVIMPTGS